MDCAQRPKRPACTHMYVVRSTFVEAQSPGDKTEDAHSHGLEAQHSRDAQHGQELNVAFTEVGDEHAHDGQQGDDSVKDVPAVLAAQNAPNLSNKITQALESMHTDTSWNHRGRAQRAMCLQPAASNFLPLLVKAQEHRSMP
eukprot:scaffold229957_cov18-Tisochrysis_lutea.AAC.1